MTPALARDMLSTFKASKQTVAAFARQHGIAKNRVTYWRHRVAELDGASLKPLAVKHDSNFAPVVTPTAPPMDVAAVPPTQTLEATLPSGTRVIVHGRWNSSSMKNWLAAIEAKA